MQTMMEQEQIADVASLNNRADTIDAFERALHDVQETLSKYYPENDFERDLYGVREMNIIRVELVRRITVNALVQAEFEARVALEIIAAAGKRGIAKDAQRVFDSLGQALQEVRKLPEPGTVGPLSAPFGLMETWFRKASAWRKRHPQQVAVEGRAPPDRSQFGSRCVAGSLSAAG
jgi:hypothetical protein